MKTLTVSTRIYGRELGRFDMALNLSHCSLIDETHLCPLSAGHSGQRSLPLAIFQHYRTRDALLEKQHELRDDGGEQIRTTQNDSTVSINARIRAMREAYYLQ